MARFLFATIPPERIRQAVRQVLSEPRFRERAKALQAEIARYDAPARAAELLETLARTRQPVLRDGSPAVSRAGG